MKHKLEAAVSPFIETVREDGQRVFANEHARYEHS